MIQTELHYNYWTDDRKCDSTESNFNYRCAADLVCEGYRYSNHGDKNCQMILKPVSHGNCQNFTATDNGVVYKKGNQ